MGGYAMDPLHGSKRSADSNELLNQPQQVRHGVL